MKLTKSLTSRRTVLEKNIGRHLLFLVALLASAAAFSARVQADGGRSADAANADPVPLHETLAPLS